jgi:hypothetical protein
MLKLRTELKLILALLNNDLAQIQSIINCEPLDWTYVYELIIRHRIWPQALTIFSQLNLSTPISTQLHHFCAQDCLKQLATSGEITRISRAFSHQNLVHAFVKGMVLNLHLYPSLTSRPCRDIDVWVDLANLDAAILVLQTLGYKQHLPQYQLTGFKRHHYLQQKHDIAFYHPERRILVELHFCLDYLGINFFPLNYNILHSVKLLNTTIPTLKDEYHLLYLIMHASIHAYSRLRWLLDIALYLKRSPHLVAQLIDLSQELSCQDLLAQAMSLVQQLFNLTLSLAVVTPRGEYLAKLALRFISTDYEMCGGLAENPRMFCLYRYYLVQITPKGQKLKTISRDLFKIDMLFPHLTLPQHCSFLYYLAYPLWVIKYIIKRGK